MGLFKGIQGKALLGACLLLTLSLSACDTKTPVEPVITDEAAANAHPELVAPESVAPESIVQAKGIVKEKPKKKLNLTLSEEAMKVSGSDLANTINVAENDFNENDFNENNTLPNMFEERQEGTTVGAGILRDAENEDYVDSIQGAEVNVEFKID